jgi:hypothetical protein
MDKILLVLNARKPRLDTIHFACGIARNAQTRLTGLFIENLYEESLPVSPIDAPYFSVITESRSPAIKADTEHAIVIFKDECRRLGVSPEVYVDKGEPIQEVIFESRFADLLVLDPSLDFYGQENQVPSHFAKEVLSRAECPVLLATHLFEHIDEIVFCYDGSASSVFAIKQFTYMLPEYSSRKIMLLEVNAPARDAFDEEHNRMMEWLKAHYRTVYYHGLNGLARKELFTYLFMKRKKLVVIGAYGRSLLSQFFRKSKADFLMGIDLPLFITHY